MMSNHALIAIAVFTLAGETKRLHVSDYHLVCSINESITIDIINW